MTLKMVPWMENNAVCKVVKKKIPDKELYETEKGVEFEESEDYFV